MDLQIFSKNLEISPAVKSYIQQKIGRLAHFLPNLSEAKVEIYEQNTKSPDNRFTVQATLSSKGVLLRGEERGEQVRGAVDAVAEVLARQIERYKGKRYDKGRGVSLARQSALTEEGDGGEEAGDWPKIVRVKRFAVKPMSVAEAAQQMELLGHAFFLFVNSESGVLSLLYCRNDGNYGLIEPEMA